MLWLGLLAGLMASVLFNLGVALQALEARRASPEEGLRLSLVMVWRPWSSSRSSPSPFVAAATKPRWGPTSAPPAASRRPISGMTALQRRPATTIVPISSAVQTFLPIALEPLFLTENWRSAELGGWMLLGGLLVMLAGTVMVARTRSVAAMST